MVEEATHEAEVASSNPADRERVKKSQALPTSSKVFFFFLSSKPFSTGNTNRY